MTVTTIILLILFIFIIWVIFIRKPYGECRWYQHKMGEWVKNERFRGTGKFINNIEIFQKYNSYTRECKKCYKIETMDTC